MATYDEYTGGGEGFTIEDLFKLYLTDKDFTKQELEIQEPLLHEGLPIPEGMGVSGEEYQQKMNPYLFRHFMDKGTLPGLGGLSTLSYLDSVNKKINKKQLGVDKGTLESLSKELGYQVSPSDALLMSGGLVGERGRGPTKEQMNAARKTYDLERGIERVRKGQLKKADEYYQDVYEAMKKSTNKTDKDKGKGKKMGGEEQRDWESRIRKSTDPEDYRQEKFKPKKEEPFVPKEKFLERIFDKRTKPGEELSNREKTRLYLKEISKNLLERRKIGGKEGTDTFSRIFGGVLEGEEAVTAKEEDIVAKRQDAVDKWYKERKESADINKVIAETVKIQAEALKQDFPEEWQMASLEAAAHGLKPNTQAYNDYIVKVLQQQRVIGNLGEIGTFYTKIADLKQQLLTTTDANEIAKINKQIAELENYAGITSSVETEDNQSSQSQAELMKGEEE